MDIPPKSPSQGGPDPGGDAYQVNVSNTPASSNQVDTWKGHVLDIPSTSIPEEVLLFDSRSPGKEVRLLEKSHRDTTQSMKPLQGHRFLRPDLGDTELYPDFQFDTPPFKMTALNPPRITRTHQLFADKAPSRYIIENESDHSQGISKKLSIEHHLKRDKSLSLDSSNDIVERHNPSPEVSSSDELSALPTQVEGIVANVSDHPSQQLDSNTVSVRKRAQEGTISEPSHSQNKRPRIETTDDLPEKPRDEIPHTPRSVPRSRPPGSHSSGHMSESRPRGMGISSRRGQHRRSRASTPFLINRLPKHIVDARTKALLKISPPRQQTSRRHPGKSPSQPEQTAHKQDVTSKKQYSDKAMAQRVRPHTSHHTSGGDLAFTGAQSTRDTSFGTSHIERHPSMLQQDQTMSPSQYAGIVRSVSEASNISRLRDPPLDSHRPVLKPSQQQHHQNLTSLTENWNNYFAYSKRYTEWQANEIASLEGMAKKKDAAIREYHEEIEVYTAENDTLVTENEKLQNLHDQMEDDLTRSQQRVEAMEEKLYSYRQRLDNAINDYPQLFKSCKEAYKETIAQFEDDRQDRVEPVEEVLYLSDSVRIALQEKVSSVVKDALKQAQERKFRPLFALGELTDKI